MRVDDRLEAFIKLGSYLRELTDDELREKIKNAHLYNAWFTKENVALAITSIGNCLERNKVAKWHDGGKLNLEQQEGKNKLPLKIGTIMAGNIPFVGFHDLICILVSGNISTMKTSSKDPELIPFLTKVLTKIEPGFKDQIQFAEKLTSIDAIIATGSNNTYRYFEYYFGKYPHIFRKNRTSVAVLTGKESKEDLTLLSDDIFQYFGLGCRNVSKLFVPEKYDFKLLLESFDKYTHLKNHHKYANNYDYNRTILLMNNQPFIDNQFVVLKEDTALFSPLAMIHYEYYNDEKKLRGKLKNEAEGIQCIVQINANDQKHINFGQTQYPELWDYADGINTMEFLSGI
ncbi:acyl-CoA reductase [Candidatus Amoebophilus asiaticus]|nr:acyl-CoA reductase [Candidatus Amoebophilus asiaticus]